MREERWGARILSLALLLLLPAGWPANPVTDRRELRLVPEAREAQIGEQYYPASQQMQCGAFAVDPELTRYVQEVGAKNMERRMLRVGELSDAF